MAVKLIGVWLTLSRLFLCAFGELKITEEQFAQFKGADPTKNCGCKENMEKFCNSIVKSSAGITEEGPFMKGYPKCQCTDVKVEKNCGGGTTLKSTNVIVCAWEKEKLYYVYGKGQTSNNVMCYETDDEGVCSFWDEYPYTDN